MTLLYCNVLILLFVQYEHIHAQFVLPPANLNEYDAYGSLLAINEYLAIIAQNDQEQFTIITYPFTNRSEKCTLPYDTIQRNISSLTRFVYNIAIGIKQNASQLIFSYIDENWQRDVFLTIVFLESTNTGCVQVVNRVAINMTDLKMQEHALSAMDPYGKRAYAVGTYYIVCFEIETGITWQLDTALVITEDHFIFTVGHKFINLQFLPYLFVLNVSSRNNVTFSFAIELSKYNFGPSAIDMTRDSTMSISLLDEMKWFIIGIPNLDMLLVLFWDRSKINKEPVIVRKHISSQRGISFGKSVALLDNGMFAVLAYTLPTLPWSTSQVQVYSIHDEELRPISIYPNNQQVIPSLKFKSIPHSILTFVAWKSHLGLVFDVGVALLLSTSSPGYYSAEIDDNSSVMDVYMSVPCIPGTARNTTSSGPCFICPPNTKSNGSLGIECETCTTNDSYLCLRGALVEIPLINIASYDQAFPYPNSPDLVSFDDILLQNIFSFVTTSPSCLIESPLFWAFFAVGLGLIIFIIMCILICFPQWKPQRIFLKKLFTHLDLIGEGEIWFGGLMTFTIIVLLVFTGKSATSFARLYPGENVSSNSESTITCNPILPNVKFSSVLQLLSIGQHEEEKPIFTMLDEQNITLTVHFVSTSFLCSNVTMQENLDRDQRIPFDKFNCSYDTKLSILSISTILPQHRITMQFQLTGPYFVGGLRICLSGSSTAEDSIKYTLKELQFCQFFYEPNETLTINPSIGIKMTKVVNRTIGYAVDDNMTLSGLWIPTLTMNTLSDVLLFGASGEYIRYLSDHITLVVDMSESEFFIKNTEEPIARHNEIILHTILLSIVFLELFGLFFLVIKLAIVPIIKLIERRILSRRNRSLEHNEKQIQLTRFTRCSDNQTQTEEQDCYNTTF
ncbi:unnamed protein product [Adineta steineri]|uniref:Uncharacterized protein n=1 Tax=Adineta steineri TaxID=433720 RepID=A0A819MGC0_9BILA|nr:unnamed protein product [Adineta steineri]